MFDKLYIRKLFTYLCKYLKKISIRIFQLREDFDSGAEVTLTDEVSVHDVATILKVMVLVIVTVTVIVMLTFLHGLGVPPRPARALVTQGGLPSSAGRTE